MWAGVIVHRPHLAVLRTHTMEFGAQTLQLLAVESDGNVNIAWQQLKHYYAVDIPPNAQHHLALVSLDLRLCRCWLTSVDPRVTERGVYEQDPFFIPCDDGVQPASCTAVREQCHASVDAALVIVVCQVEGCPHILLYHLVERVNVIANIRVVTAEVQNRRKVESIYNSANFKDVFKNGENFSDNPIE